MHSVHMNVCFHIFLLSFFTAVNGQDMKLVAGHVLFRHGDRTPITTYPTDPAKEADWPNGYGQLTSTGIEQHHRLGQYLRTRYDSILSSTYTPREIVVRSTDYDRTLMSAQSNLVGLYPVMNISNDKVPIQPIPIHTIPTAEDFLLGVNNCSHYDELEHDVYEGDEFKRMNDYYEPFFQKLQVWTDISKITMYNAWDIADTIFVEHIYNKTPAWATDDVRKNLSAVNDLSFHFLFADNGTKRIRGGPLIKEMWSNMRNIKQGESHHKVKMYSAHDTTISAVLAFLRINYPHQPSYASALFLDLYKQNVTYYVRVEYLNVTDSQQPYPYVLNGCPSINCPLETFTAIYEPIFPDSMDVECGKKNIPPGGGGNKALIIILSVIVVALALIIVAVFVYLFRRKPDDYDVLPSTDSPMPVA